MSDKPCVLILGGKSKKAFLVNFIFHTGFKSMYIGAFFVKIVLRTNSCLSFKQLIRSMFIKEKYPFCIDATAKVVWIRRSKNLETLIISVGDGCYVVLKYFTGCI